MMQIKQWVLKYLNNQNWNIGFVAISPQELVTKKTLGKVRWLKHPYKDRFFADPFIYSVDRERIVVFVEELEFDKPIGRLSELIVDARTMKLLHKHTLLELDTHLSYPAIIRQDDEVFVYPENGASGKLSLYRYNRELHKLEFEKNMMEEALADATIRRVDNEYYMFATKVPSTQEDLYVYKSQQFDSGYCEVGLMVKGRTHSRPAGDIFDMNGTLYRPAQNCVARYGAAVEIMKIIDCGNNGYQEEYCFSLKPQSYKYNLGLHTINFHNEICVIDGYGYLYPTVGRLLYGLRRIIKGRT